MFLVLYDGATHLVTAEAVQHKEEVTTMSLMTEYFLKYQINPKVVVADQAFMTSRMKAYYNRQNIKTCRNRTRNSLAEPSRSCCKTAETPFNGIVMRDGNLVHQACLARNSFDTSRL